MAVITMRQMLEAGVHFGHQTRRWNPKMKRFIFGERNGIYIIDLEQTLTRVDRAYGFVRDLVAGGGVVMFVGTKKQAQDPVRSFAEKCGMPFVNERWLGGMLTNFDTISKRVAKMLEYERMQASGEFEAMPKKEALLLTRELEKLQRNLGGLRGMSRKPDAIFVLDTKKESIAVTEANKLGIPVVAVVDTNVDPELVQYPIPGNDDAIRANSLLSRVIADAVEEGRFIAAKRDPANVPVTRTAEQEAEFNAQQAAARRAAMAAQTARERRLEEAHLPPSADPVAEEAADLTETIEQSTSDVLDAVQPAPDRSADESKTGVGSASEQPDSERSEPSDAASAPDRSADDVKTGVGSASEQPDASAASQQNGSASEQPDASASEPGDAPSAPDSSTDASESPTASAPDRSADDVKTGVGSASEQPDASASEPGK